jgi:hypothetical protein
MLKQAAIVIIGRCGGQPYRAVAEAAAGSAAALFGGGGAAPTTTTAHRCSSSSSSSHTASPHRFDLVPGMVLRVAAPEGTSVRATNGAHDAVELSGAVANVTVSNNGATVTATAEAAAAGSTGVSILLPQRFCGLSVDVTGSNGNVELAGQLNEAAIDIRTSGGE